jgi:hypothetical protein
LVNTTPQLRLDRAQHEGHGNNNDALPATAACKSTPSGGVPLSSD